MFHCNSSETVRAVRHRLKTLVNLMVSQPAKESYMPSTSFSCVVMFMSSLIIVNGLYLWKPRLNPYFLGNDSILICICTKYLNTKTGEMEVYTSHLYFWHCTIKYAQVLEWRYIQCSMLGSQYYAAGEKVHILPYRSNSLIMFIIYTLLIKEKKQ